MSVAWSENWVLQSRKMEVVDLVRWAGLGGCCGRWVTGAAKGKC